MSNKKVLPLNSCAEIIDSKKDFGFAVNFPVKKLTNKSDYIPERDEEYCFDQDVTTAILAGFMFNKRILIHGLHGSGKSTHIEQIASRLNWPCIRINLDGNITRSDLIGHDVIKIQDGKQVTEFAEGLLTHAIQNPIAIIFDEYDAGRPDVMFVLQRLLEEEGKFSLLEQNKIIHPHKNFRIFATANTIGGGDDNGIYHGTSFVNQGQLDRFNIIEELNYLSKEKEVKILEKKSKKRGIDLSKELIVKIVDFASLIRKAFECDDINNILTTRTLISWIENYKIYSSLEKAFLVAFMNRCNKEEQQIIAEIYQRVFNQELSKNK